MRIRVGAGIWLLVGALICIIILVLALFLIVFPQRNKTNEVEADIKDTETSIQLEQNRLSQMKQFDKDPEQFTRQIDVLQERIPENVELADIIQQIDHAAEEAGLDFFSIVPSLPVSAQGFYVVTSEATFYGRYFNLVEFFNHIERLPRSVKIMTLDIEAAEGGLPYLLIRITFKTYFTTTQGIEGLMQSTGG
jgi:Tfp pilus assembly protein PilO